MNLKSALFSSKKEDIIYDNVRCFFADFHGNVEKEQQLMQVFLDLNKSNINNYLILFEILEEKAFDLSDAIQNCIVEYIEKTEDYKLNIIIKRILVFCLYFSTNKQNYLFIKNKYDSVYRIESMINIYKELKDK